MLDNFGNDVAFKAARSMKGKQALRSHEYTARPLTIALVSKLPTRAIVCMVCAHVTYMQALNLAVETNQTVLLGSGALTGIIKRKWRGPLLHHVRACGLSVVGGIRLWAGLRVGGA